MKKNGWEHINYDILWYIMRKMDGKGFDFQLLNIVSGFQDDFGETSWFINTSGTFIRHINICRIYIYSDWYQHYLVNLVSSKNISKDNFLIHLVMFFRHHPASNATWFAGNLSKIWIRWLRWWSTENLKIYPLVMANIAMV
jgi:hypothetical protein